MGVAPDATALSRWLQRLGEQIVAEHAPRRGARRPARRRVGLPRSSLQSCDWRRRRWARARRDRCGGNQARCAAAGRRRPRCARQARLRSSPPARRRRRRARDGARAARGFRPCPPNAAAASVARVSAIAVSARRSTSSARIDQQLLRRVRHRDRRRRRRSRRPQRRPRPRSTARRRRSRRSDRWRDSPPCIAAAARRAECRPQA